MFLIYKVEVICCKHTCVEVTLYLILLIAFHWAHYSCCQVHYISEYRKFFSTSWCAGNSWKALSWRHSDITVRIRNIFKSLPNIKASKQSTRCIIMMCEWKQAPNAYHCTAFIVHYEFIYWALQAIDLFLHFCYDALYFFHTLLRGCWWEIDTET